MKTLLLPLTLLILTGCPEDPHIKEIEGLRAIIAQNDIDKKAATEECGIVRGDYDQASRERDACWDRGNDLEVFVLELIKAKGWKADTIYVCHEVSADRPRSPWISLDTQMEEECGSPAEFNFVFDAAGNPSFAPSED